MTIVVPAVTVARIDAAGAAVAVETNSGRPPSCGNLFFTVPAAGGSLRRGTLDQENRALRRLAADAEPWRPGWNSLS